MPKFRDPLDGVFKALADGARRSMLTRLARSEATLGQLAEPLDITLPAVHQHLGVLEDADLVISEKRGRERWCRLNHETLRRAETWIGDRRELWQGRLDALGDYLESRRGKQRGRNRT
jgi:DNA-binding transcriptional ArsR family regulator